MRRTQPLARRTGAACAGDGGVGFLQAERGVGGPESERCGAAKQKEE